MKLVKIIYRHTPGEAIAETFFSDEPDWEDSDFERVFRQYHPKGVIESMTRGVKPVDNEHHCA